MLSVPSLPCLTLLVVGAVPSVAPALCSPYITPSSVRNSIPSISISPHSSDSFIHHLFIHSYIPSYIIPPTPPHTSLSNHRFFLLLRPTQNIHSFFCTLFLRPCLHLSLSRSR
ncbi:hypothetical protein LZ32DRAFT_309954 [Colletotrichum eremochloae]|nr:hypothetical protein LZ32DRAFT_309954 [Colletotrichum eremochloae]